jgi:hypothetical protein
MDGEHDSGAEGGTESPGGHAPEDAKGVDVARLAERVYRLMRDELRHERARGAVLFSRRT